MLKGKRAYICSSVVCKKPGKIECLTWGLRRPYLDTIREVFHCRTYASHAYLPLMLDDTIPEERKLALSIGKQLLDFCDVLIICGGRISFRHAKEKSVMPMIPGRRCTGSKEAGIRFSYGR